MNNPIITRAVCRIFEFRPFLMEIGISMLEFVETEDCAFHGVPTMATDGKKVFYHPAVLKAWPLHEIQGVIVHEWLHGALLHCHRYSKLNVQSKETYNIAADYVVNDMVAEFKFSLPADSLVCPSKYKGWAVEPIYYDLLKDRKGKSGGSTGGGGDKPGKATFGGGDLRDPPPGTPVDTKGQEEQAMAQMVRLAKQAKQMGCCPAGLDIMVKDWLAPRVDWREQLCHLATICARSGWSYVRNHASYRAMNIYVPGRYSRELGDVVIVRDTSGSLYSKQDEVTAEARGALVLARPRKIVLMDCDASVHRVVELGIDDPLPPDVKGGGGTDFRPAFKKVKEMELNPVCLIYITDTCGTFPDEAPDYPVIWALIDCPPESAVPWGDRVIIPVD